MLRGMAGILRRKGEVRRSANPGGFASPAFSACSAERAAVSGCRGETVTTASDNYSLGVILYELLTGLRPSPAETDSAHEWVHLVNSQEPTRPRRAVRRAMPQRVAASRAPAPADGPDAADARRLSRRLSGDLDNIVLMALRRDQLRRFVNGRDRQFTHVHSRRRRAAHRAARRIAGGITT